MHASTKETKIKKFRASFSMKWPSVRRRRSEQVCSDCCSQLLSSSDILVLVYQFIHSTKTIKSIERDE